MSEIEGLFDFLKSIYGLFGFDFKLKLSTRPEKYLGALETWNEAEDQLKKAMTKFKGDDWTIDEGDGAFYGPKIDITIADALKREFQCATVCSTSGSSYDKCIANCDRRSNLITKHRLISRSNLCLTSRPRRPQPSPQ